MNQSSRHDRRLWTTSAFLAGESARDIVAAAGELCAVAVFERSFYAEDEEGRLVCFLCPDVEPGPINVLCRPWPTGLRNLVSEGDGFIVAGGCLVSSRFAISSSELSVWMPSDPPPFDSRLATRGVRELFRELPSFVPPACLLGVIDVGVPGLPASGYGEGGGGDILRNILIREVTKGVRELERWLGRGVDSPIGAVDLLLGLGEGLTPSGDDVLCGCLLALSAIGLLAERDELARWVLMRAGDKTNRISIAHIGEAAKGYGAMALRETITAVLKGGEGMREILPGIANIGHTSGWDSMLGIIITLKSSVNDTTETAL